MTRPLRPPTAIVVFVLLSQVEIYVEVDDVPVTGISASERVSLTASATVNDESAEDTLVSWGEPRTPPPGRPWTVSNNVGGFGVGCRKCDV